MAENSMKAIREFFGEGTRAVTTREFRDFWASCSEEDKEYYKSADLS